MHNSESRVSEAINLLADRLRQGEDARLEEVLQDFPEEADEIRSLWGTMIVAEQFSIGLSLLESVNPSDSMPSKSASPIRNKISQFELLEEVGRGGMGIVYRARQEHPNRIVALKMLLHSESATPMNRSRFHTEAQAAAHLDHPNIVSIYDVGEEGGQLYFTMPYVKGETLAKLISRGTLNERDAVSIMAPICRAIAYAHKRGVLHRDLKPSNILIDQRGHPFVSDFGLAKRFENAEDSQVQMHLTQTGAILGTPAYMAPEQAAGGRGTPGPVTDVYSLGAILYACVTGRAPFQSHNAIDAILMILEQEPPLPRLLNPQIDSDLEIIILKALQKPMDLRYQTADELADDLEAYLKGDPVSARSSQLNQVLSRMFRPTHHIGVLENWGLLWIWHAIVLFVICFSTDLMRAYHVTPDWIYPTVWATGLSAWAAFFWIARRRAGPVTFVERQIAHMWGASMASSMGLFVIESLLGLPILTLSPVLGLIAGTVFISKAGVLSGEFYLPGILLYLAIVPMCLFKSLSLTIFGIVAGVSFLWYGVKFYVIYLGNRKRRVQRDDARKSPLSEVKSATSFEMQK
ncbi:serine/threonine-protein kinase [Planctomicrobium sp. SH668]|uniref:serine/threonine-protein kinase n=1 Tax=Planctomicrobium sp. SH668 TaxID=3448126 RepID=UPI003F5CA156